jgi:hypothetical protein
MESELLEHLNFFLALTTQHVRENMCRRRFHFHSHPSDAASKIPCFHSTSSIARRGRGREWRSREANTAVPWTKDRVEPLEESVAIDEVDTPSGRTASVGIAGCGLMDGGRTVATYGLVNVPEQVGRKVPARPSQVRGLCSSM